MYHKKLRQEFPNPGYVNLLVFQGLTPIAKLPVFPLGKIHRNQLRVQKDCTVKLRLDANVYTEVARLTELGHFPGTGTFSQCPWGIDSYQGIVVTIVKYFQEQTLSS